MRGTKGVPRLWYVCVYITKWYILQYIRVRVGISVAGKLKLFPRISKNSCLIKTRWHDNAQQHQRLAIGCAVGRSWYQPVKTDQCYRIHENSTIHFWKRSVLSTNQLVHLMGLLCSTRSKPMYFYISYMLLTHASMHFFLFHTNWDQYAKSYYP